MNQHQRQIIDYFREENRVLGEQLGLFLTVMIRAFPPSVRFTGVSFSYNLSYAMFGGVTPRFVSWLVHVSRLGPAHYVAAVTLLQLLAVLMVAGPMFPAKLGSRGRGLDQSRMSSLRGNIFTTFAIQWRG